MKTTKRNLIPIWNVFEKFTQKETHRKFAYGVIKNKKILSDEIEALKAASSHTEEFKQFEKERVQICEVLCDKKEDGSPLIGPTNQYVVVENKEKLDAEINTLREKHKDALDEFDKREEEIKDLLEEEMEFDVHQIKFSLFPEFLSVQDLEILEEFIIYDEE